MKPVLLLCLILPILTGCESRKTIVTGRDEKEANEIWVFLSNKGIDVTKVQSTEGGGPGAQKEILWDIQVRSDQAAEAITLLNQSGLPRRKGQSLLGIFKEGGGLVPSEMQDKIKYESGLNEQIAHTIRKIDGVLDAEVQISFPKEDPLNIGKTRSAITASIFIKHSGVLDDPNTHLETKIKRLVAASVTGLDYDNVTVVGTRQRFSDFPGGFTGTGSQADKPYVNIWSIAIAKESVGTFRVLFFAFIFVILILASLLIWVIWKVSPMLKTQGGMASLFTLREKETAEEEEKEEVEAESEPAETEEEEGEKRPPREET